MKILKWIGVLICIAFTVFSFLYIMRESCKNPMESVEWDVEYHIVQNGESLWTIGKKYCPSNIDVRYWVSEVEELNGIGQFIYAGDKIKVLVEKEEK